MDLRTLPRLAFAVFGLALASLAAVAQPAKPLPYLDPALPTDTRVADLVSRLTLEEKDTLMKNGAAGVPRLGIPKYDWWNEALHGVARAGDATVFPQAIGLAAMWDDKFMQTVADTVSTEARAKYNEAIRQGKAGERYFGLTFWTPNINIFRDPRWGRGQETYGEDPYLTAHMGMAFVRGLQGNDPKYLKTAACAKHFAIHSGPESLRHNFDVAPDEADFRDTYTPAFEALVREAHVEIVMTAYNSVYGKPAALSDKLYNLLYQQWGFNGHVTSDCGAIEDLYKTYKVVPDAAAAEAAALKAGLCLRCSDDKPAIADAVHRGLITEAEVDVRLRQLLRTMFRLGFFDPADAVPYSQIPYSENNTPAHASIALDAARKSLVLLKNDGTLPLAKEKLKRVAVIGPNGNGVPVLLGNYNGTPTAPVTVYAGLKAALGSGVTVDYVRGCDCVASNTALTAIPRTGLEVEGGGLTGLWGDYFDNIDLSGKAVARRRDRPVDFKWGTTAPAANVPAENFSVRWAGTLLTGMPGNYQLSLKGNGGFRIYLGDKLVLDQWTPGEKTATITHYFEDNASTPIRVEYFHTTGPSAVSLQWGWPAADSGFAAAISAAKYADVIVFAGGITAQLEGEEMKIDFEGFNGGDRTLIELPKIQQRLLEALAALGKPLVFVNLSGSSVAAPWADAHVNAILQAWYPGQAGGTAIADVLLGNTNPAGRLPVTFYRATTDLPPFEDYAMKGRTYRFFTGKPLYPFGHGLSYTKFDYANLRVSPTANHTFTVSVDVTNSGARDGDEVVQLYLQEPDATHPRAKESLAGFRRVTLAHGAKQTVTFNVTATELRRWNLSKNDYAIPAGDWHILIGASSADIRQSTPAHID